MNYNYTAIFFTSVLNIICHICHDVSQTELIQDRIQRCDFVTAVFSNYIRLEELLSLLSSQSQQLYSIRRIT